jgi:general secretion pathway protein F/type IV pilus assembly protein PilC
MTFAYTVYDAAGKKLKNTISANSLEEARSILESKNYIIEHIKAKKTLFKRKMQNKALAMFARNLSIYLRSGIPLSRALYVTSSSYEGNQKLKEFTDALYDHIKSGETFAASLRMQDIYEIPHFFVYTIEIAEKSSNLEKVLIEMSNFMLNTEKVKQEVAKAFIYPSFIILVSIAMINFMLSSIVPKIITIFQSTKSELPPSTKITLMLSNFMKDYSSFLLIGFIVVILAIITILKTNKNVKKRFDKFVLSLPFLGKIMENFELGRFCKITALLLSSGVPFAQAINFSSKVYENSFLRDIFSNIAIKIVEGKSFSGALAAQSEYKMPLSFRNSIALGENSSELSYSLETLSEIYETENKDKIDIFLSLLEPMLMLIVGGMIGFIVISMLLPIFSINIQ